MVYLAQQMVIGTRDPNNNVIPGVPLARVRAPNVRLGSTKPWTFPNPNGPSITYPAMLWPETEIALTGEPAVAVTVECALAPQGKVRGTHCEKTKAFLQNSYI